MGYYPTKQELQLFQSENQKELKQQYSLLKEMPHPIRIRNIATVWYGRRI